MKDFATIPNILMAVLVTLMAWVLQNMVDMKSITATTEVRLTFVAQQLTDLKSDMKQARNVSFSRNEGEILKLGLQELEGRIGRRWGIINTLRDQQNSLIQRVSVIEGKQ